MDRHLCKAKSIDDNEWKIGYYAGDKWFIDINTLCNNIIEIDPKTLCQCTGLKDKNGNLIFEGDILLFTHRHKKADEIIKYVYRVKYDFLRGFSGIGTTKYNLMARTFHKCVVIGNIHDKEE